MWIPPDLGKEYVRREERKLKEQRNTKGKAPKRSHHRQDYSFPIPRLGLIEMLIYLAMVAGGITFFVYLISSAQ